MTRTFWGTPKRATNASYMVWRSSLVLNTAQPGIWKLEAATAYPSASCSGASGPRSETGPTGERLNPWFQTTRSPFQPSGTTIL